MEIDDDIKKFRFILVVGVLFLLSAVFSWGELKYALSGKSADAVVLQVKQTREGGRRSSPKLSVEYQFAEEGGASRREYDTMPLDWKPPQDRTVKVQYLAGSPDSSRLAGNGNMVWVYIFFGCLLALAVLLFRFWRFYKS